MAGTSDAHASGRARLAGGVCAVHGPGPDGQPCARFAHLRTDGVGVYRVGWFRRRLAALNKFVKPVVIVGLLTLSLWWMARVVPGLVHFGVPGMPTGGNSGRTAPAAVVPGGAGLTPGRASGRVPGPADWQALTWTL